MRKGSIVASFLACGLMACASGHTQDADGAARDAATPPDRDSGPSSSDMGRRDLGAPTDEDGGEPTSCTDGSTRVCGTSCGSNGVQRCVAGTFGACEPPTESCENDVDDDCDGMVDEGTMCSPGATEDCITGCGSTGIRTCGTECGWGSCAPPAETCGGGDDDCDGAVDETSACSPGEMRSCTTGCGTTGTQTCTGSCGWPLCDPPAETCNGTDDDCDGAVDEGDRAAVVSFSYATDLAGAHSGCDGSTERIGSNCDAAFDRACSARACTNGGFGPVENSADVGFGTCVVGFHHNVPWGTLATSHPGCTSPAAAQSPDCSAAIHRWCRDRGETTGFGPVELGTAHAEVVCTPWADVVSTTFATLATHQPPCDGSTERLGPNCNAAIHRFCRDRGAVSGFGPLENAGDGASVACLSN